MLIAHHDRMQSSSPTPPFFNYKLSIVVLISVTFATAFAQEIDPFSTCSFVKRKIDQRGKIVDQKSYFSTYAKIPGKGVLMLSRLGGDTAFIIHNQGAKIPFQEIENLATSNLLSKLVNPAETSNDSDAVLISGVDSYNKGGQFWLTETNFKKENSNPVTDSLYNFINEKNGGVLYQDQSTNDLSDNSIDLKIKNSEVLIISCQALF